MESLLCFFLPLGLLFCHALTSNNRIQALTSLQEMDNHLIFIINDFHTFLPPKDHEQKKKRKRKKKKKKNRIRNCVGPHNSSDSASCLTFSNSDSAEIFYQEIQLLIFFQNMNFNED